jgi:hypothetical protein
MKISKNIKNQLIGIPGVKMCPCDGCAKMRGDIIMEWETYEMITLHEIGSHPVSIKWMWMLWGKTR